MADHHLIPFQFETHSLSAITDDNGDPWWIAAEVCAILEIKNVSDAVARLDPDEKNTIVLSDGTPGNPTTLIISEAGRYFLAMRSRKAAAKKFQRWITHDVIPQIRKTGSYSLPSTQVSADPWDILAGLVEAGRKNAQDIRENTHDIRENTHDIRTLETQVRAIQSERSPVGRNACTEWLKGTGKPFLAHALFENFKAACRRREPGIPFRPANLQ